MLDSEVLAFAVADHAGIVLCTFDPAFDRQAQRIHETITGASEILNQLIRVNRPG